MANAQIEAERRQVALPPPVRRSRASITPLAAVAASLCVLFFRRPDAFYRPQFWAEDFMFLTSAEQHGLASFRIPYAGYLHFIPRTVAWMSMRLDPALQPAAFLIGWLAVLFAVLFTCLSPRLHLPAKPLLAAAVLVVPHTGEVFFNPTNAQWVAALGLILTAFKDDPSRASHWAADLAFLLFSGLSGPFVLFALPLFVRRLWIRRTRASLLLAAAAFVPAATQAWFVLHDPPAGVTGHPFDPWTFVAVVLFRTPDNLFFGAWLGARTGKTAAVLAGLGIVALLAFGIRGARADGQNEPKRDVRRDLGWLLGFAGSFVTLVSVLRRFDLMQFGDLANGDRYFFIPKVMLFWVAISTFALQGPNAMKLALLAGLVCCAASVGKQFLFAPYRDYHWYALCPSIRAGKTVRVTINPDWRFDYRRVRPSG